MFTVNAPQPLALLPTKHTKIHINTTPVPSKWFNSHTVPIKQNNNRRKTSSYTSSVTHFIQWFNNTR